MKRISMALILGLSAVLTVSAPVGVMAAEKDAAGTGAGQSGQYEDITGGWEVNQGSLELKDNKDAQNAFDKAIEGLVGRRYDLLAYLGSQVVAGTNYSYLVKTQGAYPGAQIAYKIINVYEDLSGKATLTGETDLLPDADKHLDGGWAYNQGDASVDANPDVKKALTKAAEGLADVEYKPVAYIGSQVVAGTNYAVLCEVSSITPKADKTFCLVTVYEDLSGNATISDAKEVSLAADDEAAGTFSDTNDPAVEWAVQQGITEGTSSTTFSPDRAITRAEAVTFLWRANGSPEPKALSSGFKDVTDKNAYYYKAVLWAASARYMNGTSETTFSPNAPVTKAQKN